MFDPWDIERREYRLLARALTNGDPSTDHLAAMTLVQLVKFLRAAGVGVPDFPDTGRIPIRVPAALTALVMSEGSTPVQSRSGHYPSWSLSAALIARRCWPSTV